MNLPALAGSGSVIPIGIDIIQEKSSFGASLFCRISKSKYMLKKSVAIFMYCALFFGVTILISYAVSFINGYETGEFFHILKTYIVLVLLGYLVMIFVCFAAWLTNSSCIMAAIYAATITAMQMPVLQEKISISNLTENLLLSTIVIIAFVIVLLIATIFVMQRRDCIGMKKGMSI